MKQYRLRVDLPSYPKGVIFKADCDMLGQLKGARELIHFYDAMVDPEIYQHIFEEIEVKSDVEILGKYLLNLNCECPGSLEELYIKKAQTLLLSENAINPEFLKKLRGEG